MAVRSSKVHGEILDVTNYVERKDQINDLPEAILCHILSFMPTRNAVQTGILSTRWRFLWTSVPVIHFDDIVGKMEDCPGSFMYFVERVLRLHNSPNLYKFLLQRCRDCIAIYPYRPCSWDCGAIDPYRLRSWISTAIRYHHVQELDLDIRTGSIEKLTRHLFTSTDLVVLKLRRFRFDWSPLMVILPRLKVLHLCSLNFLDEGMLQKFLSGCPALEELEIDPLQRLNALCICSSSLKKLTVYIKVRPFVRHKLVIKAPSLEILSLDDQSSIVYEVDELPALVKAIFHFGRVGYECSDDYRNAVVRMLAKASNLQHLRIDDLTLKAIIRASAYNQLLFCSLTHLDIGIREIPLAGVTDLLGRTPGLRVLVLNKTSSNLSGKVLDTDILDQLRDQAGRCSSVCLWSGAPENVPTCLSLSLEKIEFHGFYLCQHKMKLVRYLLENAMVLKKFTLHSWSRNKKIKTELQRSKKRGSSTCQIEFHHKLSSMKWLV